MSVHNDVERLEYSVLAQREHDLERSAWLSWTVSLIAAAVLLAWGIQSRSPGHMLAVVVALAAGFHALLHGRLEARVIAGYLEEFVEDESAGPHWYSRLGRLRAVPGFATANEWFAPLLSAGVVVVAIAAAWSLAGDAPKGERMAGIVTGAGGIFGLYAISQTGRLLRADVRAFWRQVPTGLREVRRSERAASR